MASEKDNGDLPQVWPFTLAGLFVMAGIVWFLLGLSVHDVGKYPSKHVHLFGHDSGPWVCIAVAVVLVIGGGIYNTLWSHRRNAAL